MTGGPPLDGKAGRQDLTARFRARRTSQSGGSSTSVPEGILRWRDFGSKEKALEAAGLSE